jgi:hypothetical protein
VAAEVVVSEECMLAFVDAVCGYGGAGGYAWQVGDAAGHTADTPLALLLLSSFDGRRLTPLDTRPSRWTLWLALV